MRGNLSKPITPSAQPSQRWFYGAIAISLLLHTIALAALTGGMDALIPEPEVAPIMVDLVPPPEPEESELEKPDPPASEEQTAEPLPPPENQSQSEEQTARLSQALPVLKPVYEFDETDSKPKSDPREAELDDPERATADTVETQDKQDTASVPSKVRENETNSTSKEQNPDIPEILNQLLETKRNTDTEVASDDPGVAEPGATLVTPKSELAPDLAEGTPVAAETPVAMTTAKVLYSETAMEDPRARTAMGLMTRSERANLLCMTEMRDQLRAARPSRPPDILPSFDLPVGTILEPQNAAFRSKGQWYDLAFRCEVNEGVTKILKFSYRIGDAIARSEWPQRGFPSF